MLLSPNLIKKGKFCRLGCPDLYTPGATIAKFNGGTITFASLVYSDVAISTTNVEKNGENFYFSIFVILFV